jgi:hypothetical protein
MRIGHPTWQALSGLGCLDQQMSFLSVAFHTQHGDVLAVKGVEDVLDFHAFRVTGIM